MHKRKKYRKGLEEKINVQNVKIWQTENGNLYGKTCYQGQYSTISKSQLISAWAKKTEKHKILYSNCLIKYDTTCKRIYLWIYGVWKSKDERYNINYKEALKNLKIL